MTKAHTLAELAGFLYDAKKREDAAKLERIDIEEQIAAMVETPDNGSKTVDAGNGLKVVVKRSLNYKADMEGLVSLDGLVIRIPVKTKQVFDEKAYEEIRASLPKDYAKISEFVTISPAKTSVTLKLA
jgi:hypothetical protein